MVLFSANRFDQAALDCCHNEKSLCEPHDTSKFTVQTLDWFHIIDHGGWAVNKPFHQSPELCPHRRASLRVRLQSAAPRWSFQTGSADLCLRCCGNRRLVKVPPFLCSSPNSSASGRNRSLPTGAEDPSKGLRKTWDPSVRWRPSGWHWARAEKGTASTGSREVNGSQRLAATLNASAFLLRVRKHGGPAKQVKH